MFSESRKYAVVFLAVLMTCMTGFWTEAASKHVVVIDPAHGGRDQGSVGIDKTAEKDVALAVALALQKELMKEKNIEVVLTRNSDKTVSLEERQKNIEKINPALVLSLHANAGFGKAASGFELYYPGLKDAGASGRAAENKYLSDTVKLARLVQKNLDVLFPRKGRGLREAGVPLAEGMTVPVLIVEMGFLTNPDDQEKLTSEKKQAEIAGALAKSIKSFF